MYMSAEVGEHKQWGQKAMEYQKEQKVCDSSKQKPSCILDKYSGTYLLYRKFNQHSPAKKWERNLWSWFVQIEQNWIWTLVLLFHVQACLWRLLLDSWKGSLLCLPIQGAPDSKLHTAYNRVNFSSPFAPITGRRGGKLNKLNVTWIGWGKVSKPDPW